MAAKVIKFTGETLMSASPRQVLEGALEEGLESVFVVGMKKGADSFFCASSIGDVAEANLLLDMAKMMLVSGCLDAAEGEG